MRRAAVLAALAACLPGCSPRPARRADGGLGRGDGARRTVERP